jgi:hypothetical protein
MIIQITANPIEWRNAWCVYTCSDANGIVQYAGVCQLRDVLTLEDAHCNSKFADVFGHPTAPMTLECVFMTLSESEARNEHRRVVGIHKPFCNYKGYYRALVYQYVKCNETGEVFQNARQAAIAKNVDPGALHRHLKGVPGHLQVKGYTFSYTMTWPLDSTPPA